MKKHLILLFTFIIAVSLVACSNQKPNESSDIEFRTIELTKENYSDYIDFIYTDAVVDDKGNITQSPYVSIKSKLYDDGWLLFYVEDADFQIRWNKDNHYWLDGNPMNILGAEYVVGLIGKTTAKDMEIVLLQGKYTFVNITDVEQYECSPGHRLVVLTDGNFTGHAQPNDFVGQFYPY